MEAKEAKFYPDVAYNKKRRLKFFSLAAVLIVFVMIFDAIFITQEIYAGLFLNAILVLVIALIPRTLRENPVKNLPVLKIDEDSVTVGVRQYSFSDIEHVKGIIYLGSVGNLVENREFLEKAAAERPPEGMLGSIELTVKKDGKEKHPVAVLVGVTEVLANLKPKLKCKFVLGYSLGKEYRTSTFNLNLINEKKEEASVSKTKQLL